MHIRRRAALTGAAALVAPATLKAQDGYPSRPMRIVVAFGPGGAADLLGRLVAERLSTTLRQSVVVENRAGAGGNIGTTAVLQAEPDGHTILLHSQGYAANRFLFDRLPFDPDKDLAPVAMVAEMPNLMVVSPSMPVGDVAGFIAMAKARGQPVTYGSIGVGTSMHIAGALFAKATGLDMSHVPYRETAAVNNDVMAGRVDVVFQTYSAALGMAQGGRMKPLAVTGSERAAATPDVPTLREAGVDLATVAWWGLLVPSAVPAARRDKLQAEVIAAVQDPIVSRRIVEAGGVPRPLDGPAFGRFIASETQRLGTVVGNTGMRAD